MIPILDKYVIKKYFFTFIGMLLLFIPIGIMVDIADKVDKFKRNNVPTSAILQYYLDFTIHIGYLLFPIFLFLGVIWFTSKMASNTETVAMFSSGISFRRFLKPYMSASAFLSVFILISGMFIIPAASRRFYEFQFAYIHRFKNDRETQNLFKQLNEHDFIYASRYVPERELAYDFIFEHFQGNTLKFRIEASLIRWVPADSSYTLTDFVRRDVGDMDDRLEIKSRKDTILPFDIEELSTVNYIAETLNYIDLAKFIKSEEKSGSPLAHQYKLVQQKRLSLPISVFVLTLIAVGVSAKKRRGGMGVSLAWGIAIGFLFIFVDKIFGVLAGQAGFSPIFAAWIPTLCFGVIALFSLNYAKR